MPLWISSWETGIASKTCVSKLKRWSVVWKCYSCRSIPI